MTTSAFAPPLSFGEQADGVTLDASQRAVVDAAIWGGKHVVLGAPGSGRTTTAVAAFAELAAAGGAEDLLLLVPTRRQAARVREAVATAVRHTVGRVLVRTPASLAFSVLRSRATLLGEPAPALLVGADQDRILAELLAGHAEGEGRPVPWPPSVPREALALRAFRGELRDVLMRAAEAGWDGEELARQGRRRRRPEWVACAAVLAEYTEITQLSSVTPDRGAQYDVATIVDEAARALATWEADLPGHEPPRWRTVIHDDYQDATLATARLLGTLAGHGSSLLLLGDPDTSVQTFRGAVPSLVARAGAAGSDVGAFGATVHTLRTVWRGTPALRSLVASLSDHLPALGGHERRRAAVAPAATGVPDGREEPGAWDPGRMRGDVDPLGSDAVEVAVVRSAGEEARLVARRLREVRLRDGVEWSRMAVVVRRTAQVAPLRRGLRAAGVPVATASAEVPLRDEPAVRPLLRALAMLDAGTCTPEEASWLLCSPLGGLDAVALRVLRRELRREEIAGGGERASDELLVELLDDPSRAATLPPRLRRACARLARTLARGAAAAAEPGASVETLLWALWDASGLASDWRERALGSGPTAERADADLDAVIALFRAAEQFADRTPGARAPDFLTYLETQEFASDTLAARGRRAESVPVLTASAAAGQEWDVVVVAGVQEDVWPDLRLRDSLLGAQAVAEVAAGRDAASAGPAQARRAVLHDELRMFVSALSRARRRLLLTAVQDGETRPSEFLRLASAGPAPRADDEPDHRLVRVPPALDLRGLVGVLRAETLRGRAADPWAVRLLASLAAAEVPFAHPDAWAGLAPTSTPQQLWADDDVVPVSPSSLEYLQACALRWLLTTAGGRSGSALPQEVGTLVHEIAADLPHGGAAELLAELDRRWPALGLPEGWAARRTRAGAEEMVRLLADYLAGVPGHVDVEVPVDVVVDRARIRGRVDRVEHTQDGVRIADLKTGATAVTAQEAEHHPQLGAYQAAARAGAFDGAAADGARLVYVGAGGRSAKHRQQAAPPPGDEDWTRAMLAEATDAMSASTFLAQANPSCERCPVRASCPVWPGGGRVVEP
ncbi:UrvD/REP family ATP-dependent DNA helicase [Beutenbergia cavernae]|uniref:UrvD/REP family ATP-dependent DNA helicase n=1 Tax=Beutenbergia cavernae TaxID=84757 RepID=UPI001FE1DDE6|nr:UrvD/REP family ATP-dependent DNA helicase [Beutenbergia cavernae]